MRAKYKIGTLVEVNTETGSRYLKVDAIIIDKDGVSYGFAPGGPDDEDIREENVLAAYRPMVARVRKQAKKSSPRAKAQPPVELRA
jgi:hypothetical protein